MQYSGERAVAGGIPDWIWKDHIERYRFGARLASGKRTLDIACGTGYGSRKLLDRGAKTIAGVDAYFGALQYAKRQYRTDGIDLLQGDIRNLPFCENAFDLITCFETIEHVADQLAILSELKRVLSADGVVVFSTPIASFLTPKNLFSILPTTSTTGSNTTRKSSCSFSPFFRCLRSIWPADYSEDMDDSRVLFCSLAAQAGVSETFPKGIRTGGCPVEKQAGRMPLQHCCLQKKELIPYGRYIQESCH